MVSSRKALLFGSIGALALFFAYAWLMLVSPNMWSSPDEAAVAYVAQNGLVTTAPFADDLGGLVSPRSLKVIHGMYVPSGWLGLPVFLRALFMLGVPFSLSVLVVPALAVAAVACWRVIVTRISGRSDVGWVAAFLLAVHPGWWHYTLRGLHPNVPFVSLLLIGIWSWMKAHEAKRPWLWAGLSGILFGSALFVRANEAVWLVPLVAIILVVIWTHASRSVRASLKAPLIAAVLGFLMPLILMGVVNEHIFGSPFASGYNRASDAIPGLSVDASVAPMTTLFKRVAESIFPFGIHEMNVFRNVLSFQVEFFWPWTLLFVFGVGWLVLERERVPKNLQTVLLGGMIVALYLLVEYGSWQFHDNPDPHAVTIGTSYIRYWLPISVWMTLFAGYGLVHALRVVSARWRAAVLGFGALGLLLTSVNMVVLSYPEGLLGMQAVARVNEARKAQVGSLTTERDVIIVDRADKYLFPERSVIVPLRSEQTYASMRLAYDAVHGRGGRLLYFGLTLPMEDVEHLNAVRLAPHGLKIQTYASVDRHTLYFIIGTSHKSPARLQNE